MDIRAMPSLEDGSADLIIDKATLDSVIDNVNGEADVALMMTECHRVLSHSNAHMHCQRTRWICANRILVCSWVHRWSDDNNIVRRRCESHASAVVSAVDRACYDAAE